MRKNLSSISRRTFLQTAATGIAAGALAGKTHAALGAEGDLRARVVSAHSGAAFAGSSPDADVPRRTCGSRFSRPTTWSASS